MAFNIQANGSTGKMEERPGIKGRNIAKVKTVSGRRPRPSQRRQKNQVREIKVPVAQ